MDDKKKKKFIIPEAELVDFKGDDIITMSNYGTLNWGDDDEETF